MSIFNANTNNLIKTLAPSVASILVDKNVGSPIKAAAIKAVLPAVGLTSAGDLVRDFKEFKKLIPTMTDTQKVQLQQADANYNAERMRHIDVSLQGDNTDRKSARDMNMAVGGRMLPFISILNTFGFYIMTTGVGYMAYKLNNDLIVGAFLTLVGNGSQLAANVSNFYFGTRAGDAHTKSLDNQSRIR